MSFVNNTNEIEHNEHDNSPVCVVLRRYFATQRERQNEIERQRGAAFATQNPLALTGGNDVVQEG